MADCAGCNLIETLTYRLMSGRVVCDTCPRANEERGAIERHVDNLDRANGRDGRNAYMDRVRAAEGKEIAIAVESEYLRRWKARQASEANIQASASPSP